MQTLTQAKLALNEVVENINNQNVDLSKNPSVLDELMDAAQCAGYLAAVDYTEKNTWYPCGFAWITLQTYKGKRVNGASKIGKLMAAHGARKHYGITGLVLWNPARCGTQSMYALSAGAQVVADALKAVGFECYVDTRID